MRSSTQKALADLNSKLSIPSLQKIDNYEEKIGVLEALSELPGVEAPLKRLLIETMADLKDIHLIASEQAA